MKENPEHVATLAELPAGHAGLVPGISPYTFIKLSDRNELEINISLVTRPVNILNTGKCIFATVGSAEVHIPLEASQVALEIQCQIQLNYSALFRDCSTLPYQFG